MHRNEPDKKNTVAKTGTATAATDSVAMRDNFRRATFWRRVSQGPATIWRTQISWRIALTVFVTILVVKASIMSVTARGFEEEQLAQVREISRVLIASSFVQSMDDSSRIDPDTSAERIFMESNISGISIYGLDYRNLYNYGSPVLLKASGKPGSAKSYRTRDGRYYEAVFSPSDHGRPYHVVARMHIAEVAGLVQQHMWESVGWLVVLTLFVTAVLMMVLSYWLLKPIMMLRHNLLSAAQNPERPEILSPKKETRDELGMALRIASDLIRQNALNIKKLRAQAEDKIHKLAYYDNLTDLPNRTFFLEKLEGHIKHHVVEEDGRLAIFVVDVDNFKDINDTMGHEFGDKLLQAISKRLVKALPEDALISRASADEFTIMCTLKPDSPDSAIMVDNIFHAMAEPMSMMQEKFQVHVSVGVSHCPDDGLEAQQIMKNADIALNRAKSEGRETARYYSEDLDQAVQQRFHILRGLRTAIDQKQLRLHYHPQFDLRTGELIGAEALVRWWRPDNSREGGTLIPPTEFIHIAEQSGLIVPIGEWVLKSACEMNKGWQEQGIPPFRIAVNISSVQFHRANIVGLVSETLRETQLDPRYLELEVTESVFMENMEIAINVLNQLHKLGVELAIDDFGTGYSSLNYLRHFPIDRLKIDQSFVKNALTNPDDQMIAKTIISLGHSLGLKVIAEGVETSDHEDFLRREGCDEVQGFKYIKPVPAEEFGEFVLAYNRNLARSSKLAVVDDNN